MRSFVSLCLLSSAALATCQNAQRAENSSSPATTTTGDLPTVTLDYSTIQAVGGNTTVGYYKYQNIRFAAVPTGDLRWAAPEWPPVETEVNTGSLADADVDCSSAEDCLYMDIWAPADAVGRDLPVVVWTYGGGFTGGSKAQDTPEGLFDLSTDFIFVSYNYRLGMTGLANGPTFNHQGGIANACIWDVTHAFEWVRKYISNFGGNPEDVTAMGFSAGGSQVLFQMTRFAGRAEQLFQKAYVMSPGFVPGAGHQHAEAFWQNVSSSVGCTGGDLTCMRAVDFDTLIEAGSNVTSDYDYQFQPRVDGLIVADTYEAQFYQQRFNFSGPVVISHELHEANSQAYSGVDTEDDVATELRVFFPAIEDSVVDQILAYYPEEDYTSAGLRFADMKQHLDLTAHNLALTHALNNQTWNAMVALGQATHGTDQSYYFYSTYSLDTSSSDDTATATTSAAAAATSAAGNSTGGGMGGGMGSTDVDATVAVTMQKYLLSFILTGNPNTEWADDKLFWPKYNESTAGTEIVFNTSMYLQDDDLALDKVVYWNKALWY